MAKRSFGSRGFTPVGVADTTNFTNAGFMALQGAAATQRTFIREVNIQGIASASAPTPLVLGRDSTIGVTLTALAAPNSDGPLSPATAALAAPVVPFVAASGTVPKRDVAAAILALGLNAFGGIMYWVAAQGEEWQMYGNAASFGESSLSCFTGGTPGLVTAHMIYETE